MKSGLILFAAAVLAVVCEARLAEKVSEDDDFVVYRIPVKALDLQSQATGHFEGYELSPSYGRSSSKSSSHSKSTSSSTGSGKGKGYGQGSSQGTGHGTGGSSSGHGYGSSDGGHGGEYSSGTGSGYGGSGTGHGGSGSGYGGSGSGYGGSGSGYGGSGSGYGGSGSGYGGSGSGYGGHYRGGYSPSYSPSYNDGGHGPSSHYDDEEGDGPKVITTTKTVTTSSAHDTGVDKIREPGYNYRQPSDSLGDIKFKLGDYLKDAPGHEASINFGKNFFQGASSEFAPGYRSGQGFNVNEFTRSLNQGMGAVLANPSYRNNRFVPQASIVIPRAYAFRHAGFGLPGF